jgi:glycine/D-amino acid oxidase-like deaminating enzyme
LFLKVHRSTAVAVLGAGLTGVATALELARRGSYVTLIEQDERAVNRASLRNEGKIHLGFIYANDSSLVTARLQLQGALRFRSLLTRWIGSHADTLPKSAPFIYLVARDSLLSVDKLEQHYSAVERMYLDYLKDSRACDYLGIRAGTLYQACEIKEISSFFDTRAFSAAFRTAEIAIDTQDLAQHLRAAVRDSERVSFLPRHRVTSVTRANGVHRVEGAGPEGCWRLDADQVVNALWENRLALDAAFGLECAPGWLHRLKYRVIARVPERFRGAPSATMVLGRYGDVVMRHDGTVYLSWYPTGLAGWSHDIAPPSSWQAACRGELSDSDKATIAEETLSALDSWYPGIADAQPLIVDAGAIVAYGRTDVDDAASGLHNRSRVGVSSSDGYHSVDPGKLTTAPLFAALAAERVLGVNIPA